VSVLGGISPPAGLPIGAPVVSETVPLQRLGAELNAQITPAFFTWLVGPCTIEEAQVSGAPPSSDAREGRRGGRRETKVLRECSEDLEVPIPGDQRVRGDVRARPLQGAHAVLLQQGARVRCCVLTQLALRENKPIPRLSLARAKELIFLFPLTRHA